MREGMERKDRVPFSAPNLTSLCINEMSDGDWSGCWYHLYDRKPVTFTGTRELLRQLEAFFDTLQYPQASTRSRSFREDGMPGGGCRVEGRREKQLVTREELLQHEGGCGTVILAVQYRQNTTWQGKGFVSETGACFPFSSELDLLKRIEEAIRALMSRSIS